MKKILVTDTMFIFPEHEEKLKAAGYEIERLAKPDASEEELVEAVKGKIGYIIGGLERVTDRVIEAADEMKIIAFTGAGLYAYVPGHELATKKKIALSSAPGANSYAVAEFTIFLILLMLRRGIQLGRTGGETFITTQSLADSHIGIVGMGHVATHVARMLKGMGAKRVSYTNRSRKPELESEIGIGFLEPEQLFSECDVVTNHLPSDAGKVITKELLEKTKEGFIFVNAGSDFSFDSDVLYDRLVNHHAHAAFDMHESVPDDRYKDLPPEVCFYTNAQSGFNTLAANKLASDMATETIINFLASGKDKYVVNL